MGREPDFDTKLTGKAVFKNGAFFGSNHFYGPPILLLIGSIRYETGPRPDPFGTAEIGLPTAHHFGPNSDSRPGPVRTSLSSM